MVGEDHREPQPTQAIGRTTRDHAYDALVEVVA
jgi:hypothetical protein